MITISEYKSAMQIMEHFENQYIPSWNNRSSLVCKIWSRTPVFDLFRICVIYYCKIEIYEKSEFEQKWICHFWFTIQLQITDNL